MLPDRLDFAVDFLTSEGVAMWAVAVLDGPTDLAIVEVIAR